MPGFIALILILFGIVSLVKPEIPWYLNIGWKVKDAEPSDAALLWNRFLGGVMVVVGVIGLFA